MRTKLWALTASAVVAAGSLLLLVYAHGAQRPLSHKTPVRVSKMTLVPYYAMDNTLRSLRVTAEYQQVESLPNGQIDAVDRATIEFDLVLADPANPTKSDFTTESLMIDGTEGPEIYHYTEIGTTAIAAAMKEYHKAFPSALPVRVQRRGARVPIHRPAPAK